MTQPVESLPEIMRRTKANLEFIQRERDVRIAAGFDVDVQGPFEVTQLVNSFMGAFAHPFEAVFKLQDPSPSIRDDLESLNEILLEGASEQQGPPSLEEAIGNVRNAFAHGNIEFIGGVVKDSGQSSRKDIVAVRLWNCRFEGPKKNGYREQIKTWEKELSVSELERLLYIFVDVMSRADPNLFDRASDCPPKPLPNWKPKVVCP